VLAFAILVCSTALLPATAEETDTPIPPSLITPDQVETTLGTLEFKDGAPSAETLAKIYDNLDFTHAFAFWFSGGVSWRTMIRSPRWI